MLRTRLFLSLLPLVVILLATGVFAVALISRLADRVDDAFAENYQVILASHKMSAALAGMNREVWAYQYTGGEFGGEQQRFEESLAQQLKRVSLPGEKALNEQLAAAYQDFQQAVVRLNLPHASRDPIQSYQRAVEVKVAQMNSLLNKLRELNYRAVLDTNRGIQKSTRDVTQLMTIGVAIVLIISMFTCYQLGRAILRPIQMLTKATRELGEGDLHQPVPVVSRDELGELAGAFNKMAAQLQEYRRNTSGEIVRLHRTMETTLASFPDPIFVLDHGGRIELRNPAADGLATSLHLNGQLPYHLQDMAQKALASGENYLPHSFDEVIAHRLNGAEKFFLPRILVMRDKENILFGVAVVLYDVTRFRLLDGAKTNLVGTVSHELRSPLTSVRMALHILLERTVGDLTPQQSELLEAARDDAERLLRILNDLLDLARLDDQGAELNKENVAPADLLQRVIEENADMISARGLKMSCAVEPELPGVSVDRQRISHVFTNLVSNAVKHSPPGGEIHLQAAGAEDGAVQFSVTDQGAGVPEEFQLRIFDRFFRVPDQSRNGAGLGLSIAKEITTAHGGRIGVNSSPGNGSTFFVILKAATG